MAKKFIVIALAVFAFGFEVRSNAGTEVIDRYSGAPAPAYNYAPPPRPVYYAPRPPVNVLVFPAYGYYGPRFGVHRFYGRHVFWRSHPRWR
jgi:hypothetical protein